MSKKKNTPLRKFLGVINENSENFQDKNFLEFLNEQGESLLRKEKKVIEKSFFAGFDKSVDIFELSQPENRKETCRALDLGHEYYSENFKSYFLKELVGVDEKVLMKNDLSEENQETWDKILEDDSKLDFVNKILNEVLTKSTPETSESIKSKLENELNKNGINFKSIQVIKK